MDIETMVTKYVQLRDLIKAKDDEHKKAMKPLRETLETLNGYILQSLNAAGIDSARTKAGTAYRKIEKSATIADKALFSRYVIGAEAWHLIDWRANVTAVTAMVDEHQEPPPGVNYSTKVDVGVRRANGE